jgi:hypothetical protein
MSQQLGFETIVNVGNYFNPVWAPMIISTSGGTA